MPDHPHVLVATLGGQPQIITFTLDLLLGAGFPISEVIVVHPQATESSRLGQALQRLRTEFSHATYQQTERSITLQSYALELDTAPIDDIIDESHADGTLDTLHQLLGNLKRKGSRIHLSVSGGRRLMSLLAIPVALFSFDRYDRIWHLYTPDTIRTKADEGALMHVPASCGLKLIQAPFVFLGNYASYAPAQPFRTMQEEQRSHLEAQERTLCAKVANNVTPAERKVLRAFAKGLRPQQVANELCITPATVNSHKTKIFGHCHTAWDIPDEERLDYRFLAAKFANYFASDE
ncbi:MAG: CRISPR-associated ring nuclease [Ktedonobacteraceae bacterium]